MAREIETAGGRDLNHIRTEFARLLQGKPLRQIDEWGKVHVDTLTMSLRSRLSVEVAYSLTTLIVISTMRGPTTDSGFPVQQAEELLEEMLDFLEELAWDGEPDNELSSGEDIRLVTSKELLASAHEGEEGPFADHRPKQGTYDSSKPGPAQRKGDLIRIVVNILRNLSAIVENQGIMAQHPTLTSFLLRLTALEVTETGTLRATSSSLTLPDLVIIRKDVLFTLVNLAGFVDFSSNSCPAAEQSRKAQRAFELASSYLADSSEAVSPAAWIIQTGAMIGPHMRAPLLADAALEMFTRISQPDGNRQIIAEFVPKVWQSRLFESIIHRLPVVEQDFAVVTREESWMSHLEKLILAFYSLAFLMPPDLKKQLKSNRGLSFSKIVFRLIKRCTQTEAFRTYFHYCIRRAVEAMKLMDEASNSFDVSQPSVPQLSFGVGYGEVGDKHIEKGTGLWGAQRDDLLWGLMLARDLDEVAFSELESLTRVECTS